MLQGFFNGRSSKPLEPAHKQYLGTGFIPAGVQHSIQAGVSTWSLMRQVRKPLMVANKPLLSIQPVAVQFQDAMYAFDQAVHPMLSGLEQHAGQLGHQPEWGKDQADEISMWHSDLYTTSPHEDMLQGCSN